MRCCNCYHTFSSDDVVYQNESHGETVACCPSCGVSDMESTSACRICCDDFTEDEIMFGFCLDCLWEAIDYDISLKYMMQGKTLVDFLLNDWYESRVDIDYCSDQLFAFSVEQFKRLVADEKLMCAVSRNQNTTRDHLAYRAEILQNGTQIILRKR